MRVRRMQEAVNVIKGLWSNSPLIFSGRYNTITGLTGLPTPVQGPHPPIFIGACGKQSLTFATQEASNVGLSLTTLPAGGLDIPSVNQAALEEKVGWVRARQILDEERLAHIRRNGNQVAASSTVDPRDGLSPHGSPL